MALLPAITTVAAIGKGLGLWGRPPAEFVTKRVGDQLQLMHTPTNTLLAKENADLVTYLYNPDKQKVNAGDVIKSRLQWSKEVRDNALAGGTYSTENLIRNKMANLPNIDFTKINQFLGKVEQVATVGQTIYNTSKNTWDQISATAQTLKPNKTQNNMLTSTPGTTIGNGGGGSIPPWVFWGGIALLALYGKKLFR